VGDERLALTGALLLVVLDDGDGDA